MAAMTYSSKDPRNSVAYFNGAVYTVDQSRPWAEAFIVTSGGFFEAVGTNQEIKAIAKERCLVSYDLQGNFVMPGIHDAHTHLLAASMQRLGEASISLDTTGSAIGKNIAKGCCACPFSNVYGDWVIGNFYQAAQFPDGKPDRKYIDDEYPDIPVLIREVSCHRILLNSAGLARMGIDRDVKDPHGGYYIRRPDGELTGEIVETAAQPVWNNIPKTPLHYVKTALTMAIRECHRYGITSAQEASANTLLLHAAKELEDENRFDIDLCTHIVCAPEGPTMEAIDSLALLLDVSGSFASKHLHTHFVKFFMDGAPLPPEFTQSDLDAGGRPVESRLNLTFDKLLGYLVKYDARGMTCKIHVAGEGSVRRVLDVLEELRRQNPNGPKHELAHCNAVHPDDVPRFATLGLTAEMSPAIFHHDVCRQLPHLFKWPFNEVLATGARVTIGSDWILTPNPSLFDALASIVEKVKGPDVENHAGKSEKQIGGELLCRIITMGGAEAVGHDKITGSIEVGKKANFIAVDRDLSAGNFDGATVLKTWFEGRIVYVSPPGDMLV